MWYSAITEYEKIAMEMNQEMKALLKMKKLTPQVSEDIDAFGKSLV